MQLASGVVTHALTTFPGDLYVVSGRRTGKGYVEAFDSNGVSQWSFEHGTDIVEVVPVGQDRLLGLALTPRLVFLRDVESQRVIWEQPLNDDFIDFPKLGPTSYFVAGAPRHVAASANGDLAVLVRGSGWIDYHVTMGLDPETGEQLWLHYDDADWFFSNELRFNDVGGWFVHMASYGVGGGAGFRTRRLDPDTGTQLDAPSGPSGGGTPGHSPGTFTLRSDGSLVVTRNVSSPFADTAHVVTLRPDGTYGDTVEFTTSFPPTNGSTTVDANDRVYFLVGRHATSEGMQALYRLDADASLHEVQRRCDEDELHEIAAVGAHALGVIGRNDTGDFLEQYCFE